MGKVSLRTFIRETSYEESIYFGQKRYLYIISLLLHHDSWIRQKGRDTNFKSILSLLAENFYQVPFLEYSFSTTILRVFLSRLLATIIEKRLEKLI